MRSSRQGYMYTYIYRDTCSCSNPLTSLEVPSTWTSHIPIHMELQSQNNGYVVYSGPGRFEGTGSYIDRIAAQKGLGLHDL